MDTTSLIVVLIEVKRPAFLFYSLFQRRHDYCKAIIGMVVYEQNQVGGQNSIIFRYLQMLLVNCKRFFLMSFSLPELSYPKDAFGKILSAQTFDYHHGKHHKTYIDNLNNLIKGTQWENKSLENILMKCVHGKIFNNAAQHWNHTFYWHCMTPDHIEPEGQLKQAIVAKWGSVDKFLEDFTNQAQDNFGSGWTWLAKQGKEIAIVNTSNAGNPLTSQFQPLLTVDIWQHAYYIDHRNSRANYLKNFKSIINWKFVENNYKAQKVELKL